MRSRRDVAGFRHTVGDGRAAGLAAFVGDRCATVSPAQLLEQAWPGPRSGRSKIRSELPVEDAGWVRAGRAHAGSRMRGLERGAAESCTVLVEHSVGVLSVFAPESCEQGRRILAAAVSGLAS